MDNNDASSSVYVKVNFFNLEIFGNSVTLVEDVSNRLPAGLVFTPEAAKKFSVKRLFSCPYYPICNDFAARPSRFISSEAANKFYTLPRWICGYCEQGKILDPDKKRDWIGDQEQMRHKHEEESGKDKLKPSISIISLELRPREKKRYLKESVADENQTEFQKNRDHKIYGYELVAPDEKIFKIEADNRREAILAAGKKMEKDRTNYCLNEINENGQARKIEYKFLYYHDCHREELIGKKTGKIQFFELHYEGRLYPLGLHLKRKTLIPELKKIIGSNYLSARLFAVREDGLLRQNLAFYEDAIVPFYIRINNVKYPVFSEKIDDVIRKAKVYVKNLANKDKVEIIRNLFPGETVVKILDL